MIGRYVLSKAILHITNHVDTGFCLYKLLINACYVLLRPIYIHPMLRPMRLDLGLKKDK